MFVKVAVVQVRLTCVSESPSVSVGEIWGGNRLQGVLNTGTGWVSVRNCAPSALQPCFPLGFITRGALPVGQERYPVGQEIPCSSSDHAQLNSETGRACTRVLGRTCFQRRVRPCSYRRTEARRDGKTRKVYSTTLRCSV